MFLQQIEQRVAEGRDFAFETTLLGRGYLRLVRRLKSAGCWVELLYLALGGWRLSFEIAVKEKAPVELRASLMQGNDAISEVWVYRWTP